MIWASLSTLATTVAAMALSLLVFRLYQRMQLSQRMGQNRTLVVLPKPVAQFFRRRRERPHLERKFPFVLDMLCLSLEAGLDFVSAIARIADQLPNHPMGRALQSLLADLRLGRPRADALRRFRLHVNLPAATRLTSLLIQADMLGAPIANLLRDEASSLRFERFQNAERVGQVAAQKLLFPLVFCIMPVVFLVVFGPLAVQLAQGGL